MNKEQRYNKNRKEQARHILKDGILDMNVARLIQMSKFGLIGNINVTNELISIQNVFNYITYDEKNNIITFSVKEEQGKYGSISFSVDAISAISGCEDTKNPEKYLNVNIVLKDRVAIGIKILY